ncbi:MAG: epoxyqueuosine reductase QueH [Treponema sp.]|nr:epoxyqueuosine reductase QueH [Candidatus Treponema equifaecale]
MGELPFHKQLEKIIEKIEEQQKSPDFRKPALLLHACCGPCSSYVIEYISRYFDITIYYYNPNIHPAEEYYRRLNELKKFLTQFPDAKSNCVKLVEDSYNPEEYFEATNVENEPELQTEPEKGERCRRCYEFRMKRAYEYACKNNFDWFTTTLSISPHKDSNKINVIGKCLETEKNDVMEDKVAFTKFLPSDFKKKGGFLRSTQLSDEYGLWRQDYCGCVYSKQNMKKNQ